MSFRSVFLLSLLMAFAVPASAAEPAKLEFNRDIRPILSDACFHCHGPDAEHREAELRLDEPESALDSAIVPGKPDDSSLVARITAEDPAERMPPAASGKELTADEIEKLRKWVEQGASYQAAWAYVLPKRHALPGTQQPNETWIDCLIRQRWEEEGLEAAAAADPVTRVRRLSFDLTGLPPSPQDVDAFVADPTPQQWEKLVDRYLASPHFGERMAMYWLDLVRYADTVGYHGDQDHSISPYRDWVIRSFNNNLPFDRFTREQLAGDLLPDSTVDQKIATGYNRLLQTSHEGGVQPQEYLAIYAADRVRNVSAVWLGGTLGCAQCHDHKYDPYSMRDFYSMSAFFADVDEEQHFKTGSNQLPTARPPEIDVLRPQLRERLAELQQRRDALGEEESAARQKLEQEIAAIEKQRRRTMVTVSIEPRVTRILPRGNWLDESGPLVTPDIPEFLGKLEHAGERATRLDLANWLTGPEQGLLTARVFANRIWYLMFGVGISRTLDDFGGQGEPPAHPELLDHLAHAFVDGGWNLKDLVKTIAMTRVYQLSSAATTRQLEVDPENRLYARQGRFRLSAEMIRDNALVISGLLIDEVGGPSIKPYQPVGYYRHLNFPTRKYKHDANSRQWRRGVYVHWQRQFLHPMLRAFDAPSREECTAERPRSNTPLAALTLLNDPTFVEAARMFGVRILKEGGTSFDERLDFAFRTALSRLPDKKERALFSEFLKQTQAYFTQPDAARELLEVGDTPVVADLDSGELASWTSVARALLNLQETVTRK